MVGGLLSLSTFPGGGLVNAKIPIKLSLAYCPLPLWAAGRDRISGNGHRNLGIRSVMTGTRGGGREQNHGGGDQYQYFDDDEDEAHGHRAAEPEAGQYSSSSQRHSAGVDTSRQRGANSDNNTQTISDDRAAKAAAFKA